MSRIRFNSPHPSAWAAAPYFAPRSWLIALSLSLVALHLTLLWRVGMQMDDLMLNGAFWAVLCPKLYRQYQRAVAEGSAVAFCLGTLLIIGILMRCVSLYGVEASFAKLMPLFIVTGMGLIATGRKVYYYWPELLLLLPLAMPRTVLTNWMSQGAGEPLQNATATMASFVLHYVGFVVSTRQATISLPQGSVEVELACTIFPSLLVLFQLAVLFGAMLPISWKQQAFVLALCVSIAGFASVVRVSILAFAVDRPELFSFWHGDPGKQIISTGLIFCMIGIHHYFYRQGELEGAANA